MSRPPWKSPQLSTEERKRREHEQSEYEPGYCNECEKKRCPPTMDVCPVCHPNTEYTEEDA